MKLFVEGLKEMYAVLEMPYRTLTIRTLNSAIWHLVNCASMLCATQIDTR